VAALALAGGPSITAGAGIQQLVRLVVKARAVLVLGCHVSPVGVVSMNRYELERQLEERRSHTDRVEDEGKALARALEQMNKIQVYSSSSSSSSSSSCDHPALSHGHGHGHSLGAE
jgi:hypothetical protein